MEVTRDNDRRWKKSPYMESLRDIAEKRSVEKQHFLIPRSFFNFHCQNSFTYFTYQSAILPIAYNTTASLAMLSCTKFKDFRKCQEKFGQFSRSKETANTGTLHLNCSRDATTETLAWFKFS